MCVCAWVGACARGVRFSNSNRIKPRDYRILLLLKMPIPTVKEGVGGTEERVESFEEIAFDRCFVDLVVEV